VIVTDPPYEPRIKSSHDLSSQQTRDPATCSLRRSARSSRLSLPADVRRDFHAKPLVAAEVRGALLCERLDALTEVVRLLEEAVGEPFELEPQR
jgi:hypothetical protein